jgi:N-acetylmuramoyl-L-alanine amidase/putative methionine-R-sulfoxide reductase with GAF domain
MSVIPTNSDLELIAGSDTPTSDLASPAGTRADSAGRDAFEALLAFSALHQQIRQCREQEPETQDQLRREDSRQLEQFVLDEVLQLVAERALTITGADGVAIALAHSDAIICRASAGPVAPDHGMRIDPDSGFSGACLISGQIIRCDDTESDARVDARACAALGARSMVAVPLSAKATVIGLLEAFSTETYGFNDSDVRSLALLAELILAALRPEEEGSLTEASRRIVGQNELRNVASEPAKLAATPEEPPPAQKPTNNAATPSLEKITNRTPGLGLVVALILFGTLLGAGLWWKMRTPDSKAAPRQTLVSVQAAVAPVERIPVAQHSEEQPPVSEEPTFGKPATAAQLAALPTVTGIRHWSSGDSSTVVIDLQDQVQYEAHRLTNPERIYFDLHDTRLTPELSGKNIEIGDPLIQRVRVAQPVPGITRVVLETKGASNFSVSLEINPYRLVVEVRKTGSQSQARSKINLFAPQQQSASAEGAQVPPAASRLRVVLDAGHGGWDLGTVGKRGLLEKDLALDIVNRLGDLVERRLGAEVIYTRKDDTYVALEKRTEIANLSAADFFLSVHANYSDYPSARGVETYYTDTYSSIKARLAEDGKTDAKLQNVNWTHVDIREKVRESHRLAQSVQHALYGTLAKRNPGLPNRGVKEAQYVVLTGTTMPAILAEISFVSSPTDEDNLQSAKYRQQIAEALYQGVLRYAETTNHVKTAGAGVKPGAE